MMIGIAFYGYMIATFQTLFAELGESANADD